MQIAFFHAVFVVTPTPLERWHTEWPYVRVQNTICFVFFRTFGHTVFPHVGGVWSPGAWFAHFGVRNMSESIL